MKELAPGVYRLDQWPRPIINIYLAGDVLIDAGTRGDRRRVHKQLAQRKLSMLALTHAHPDHQGVAGDVCDTFDVPLACHPDDVDAMEGRRPLIDNDPDKFVNRLVVKLWAGPPRKVDRTFREGDRVGEFEVVEAPGHTRGHVMFFRESDRVVICGDVVRNMSYLTTRSGIRRPPDPFTYDEAQNHRSIRKLAELEPRLILPGHGPEITDMPEFDRFVASLPRD